jgi:hypothetical protein
LQERFPGRSCCNTDAFALNHDALGRFVVRRRAVGGDSRAVRQIDDEVAPVTSCRAERELKQVFRICHGVRPHPFEEMVQNIPDSGSGKSRSIPPLAKEGEDKVARTQDGLQGHGHEVPGVEARLPCHQIGFWHD